MGFRKPKDGSRYSVLWNRFLTDNAGLIAETGVPVAFFEDRRLFDDFLMHGYMDHHPDTTDFSIDQLNLEQLTATAHLAAAYFRAGFPDPGLSLFGALIDSQIRAAATRE